MITITTAQQGTTTFHGIILGSATSEDKQHNHPDNLEVLCMSCHSRMHKQAWWDAQNSAS